MNKYMRWFPTIVIWSSIMVLLSGFHRVRTNVYPRFHGAQEEIVQNLTRELVQRKELGTKVCGLQT